MRSENEQEPVDPAMRLASVVRDLRTRLGPTCRDWPPELFTSMVEGLAEITLRYEGQSSTSTYDRRTTDRLVAELKEVLTRSSQKRDGAAD